MAQRFFTPLNGDEVKKMILKEIEKDLDQDADFRQHLTYPTIEWEWQLKITCQQRESQDVARTITGKAITVDKETNQELPPQADDKPRSRLLKRNRAVTTPDKERIKSNLPVNVRENIPGVGMHDVPQRGIEGRGVVIKTRASEGFKFNNGNS